MRIITIKEPFATLIMNQVKTTETRSWRTKYRGEIYIHAGAKKLNYNNKNSDFKKIADNFEYNPGFVLCKCNLVDCVEMTKEYIEDMKKNHYDEYICGEYKIGRFAWILKDVEQINPFFVKGRLGIWHYDN